MRAARALRCHGPTQIVELMMCVSRDVDVLVEIGAALIDADAVAGRGKQRESAPFLVQRLEANEKRAIELRIVAGSASPRAPGSTLPMYVEIVRLRFETVRGSTATAAAGGRTGSGRASSCESRGRKSGTCARSSRVRCSMALRRLDAPGPLPRPLGEREEGLLVVGRRLRGDRVRSRAAGSSRTGTCACTTGCRGRRRHRRPAGRCSSGRSFPARNPSRDRDSGW